MPLFIVSSYKKLTIKRGIIHIIIKVLFKASLIKARIREVKKNVFLENVPKNTIKKFNK